MGSIEAHVVRALYEWAAGSALAARVVAAAAQWLVLLVPLALLLAWWWPAPGRAARRRGIVGSLIAVALGGATAAALLAVVHRSRPFVALQLQPLVEHGASASFPSAEVLLASALAVPLLWQQRRLGAALLLVALLAGIARVAAALNWPSDVIGSLALALLLGALAVSLSRRALAWLPAGWATPQPAPPAAPVAAPAPAAGPASSSSLPPLRPPPIEPTPTTMVGGVRVRPPQPRETREGLNLPGATRLYWSGPPGLAELQVVTPGGYWGRVLEAPLLAAPEQPGQECVALPTAEVPATILEMALEWVRVAEFPDRPSRAQCLFTWESEEVARAYHRTRRQASLYEVLPVGGARLFRADYTLGNTFREHDTLEKLAERARRYWRGEPEGQVEVLVEGPLVIARVLL